jgi:hypothetical protein
VHELAKHGGHERRLVVALAQAEVVREELLLGHRGCPGGLEGVVEPVDVVMTVMVKRVSLVTWSVGIDNVTHARLHDVKG